MFKKNALLKLINVWTPFLGAGIKLMKVNDDFTSLEVEMKLRFWNRNYVGTHFGGSLFAMTDPFYMLMLIQNLGPDYIVWDKAANINFKKPGRGKVRASFNLTKEKIAELKSLADRDPKVEPVFRVEIFDEAGVLIAEVDRTLYIKRKDKIQKREST